MIPARILRAAELLREDAECLRMSHTINGEWPPDEDTDAREVCEEMLALSVELDAIARARSRTALERLARVWAKRYHLYAVAGRNGKVHGKTQAQRLAEAEAALRELLLYRDQPPPGAP